MAERSFDAVSALCVAHVNSLQRHQRQLMAKSGKFVWRAYLRTALDCKKTTVWSFLPSWGTLLFEMGSGGGGGGSEIRRGSPQWNTKARLPKPQTATVASAQWLKWRSTYGSRTKRRRTASAEPISEKEIKLIPKINGTRKGECTRSCSRWQTPPQKICKFLGTNQYLRSEWHWFVHALRFEDILSVCHLEQLHTPSPFVFPIDFGIYPYKTVVCACLDLSVRNLSAVRISRRRTPRSIDPQATGRAKERANESRRSGETAYAVSTTKRWSPFSWTVYLSCYQWKKWWNGTLANTSLAKHQSACIWLLAAPQWSSGSKEPGGSLLQRDSLRVGHWI